jgi:hypothetical protein
MGRETPGPVLAPHALRLRPDHAAIFLVAGDEATTGRSPVRRVAGREGQGGRTMSSGHRRQDKTATSARSLQILVTGVYLRLWRLS